MQYGRSYIRVGLALIDRARASFSGNLFLCCQPIEQERRMGEHTILLKVYKLLDAMELSGYPWTKQPQSTPPPLQLAARRFELMRESFVQHRRNDEQETEKAPFLVIKKIRDAILDETFKPGERLPDAQKDLP
jgi:hypothetical protein